MSSAHQDELRSLLEGFQRLADRARDQERRSRFLQIISELQALLRELEEKAANGTAARLGSSTPP